MADFGFDSTAEQVTEGLNLSGQRWLITGVNSGLGHETARVLALRGAHIVGAARSEAKAAAALQQLGIAGSAVGCELSDLSSVRCAVDAVDGPLDGIIANAGIMALPRLQQTQGIEQQLFTNHVGHFALITGLLPKLSAQGSVVVLSSAAHRMAKDLELNNLSGEDNYHPWRMYGRSKLANILFANALSRRLQAGQRANSLHPGVIQTNLARHVPDPEGLFARMKTSMKTVAQGAATQCYVAVHPDVSSTTGAYFSDCQQTAPTDIAQNEALAEQLWTISEQLIA